jgi:tetratricopeptide (TPR) repeat protein
LSHSANSRAARFDARGNRDDIDVSIDLSRQALNCAESLGQATSLVRMNLGAAIGTRYEAFGDRQDLDECIAMNRVVIAESNESDLFQRFAFSNLISYLIDRFDITGVEDDLDEAWNLVQVQLPKTPPGNQIYAILLWSIASIYQRRYGIRRCHGDLNEAISAFTLCLEKSHARHAREDRLLGLAKALLLRVKDFGSTTEDLQHAIVLLREVLELRPPGHPRRHEALNALSEAYANRFEHTRLSSDLDEALHLQCESIDTLPPGYTYRAQAIFGLARLHLLHESAIFDLKKALGLAIEAVRDNTGAAQLLEFYRDVIALIPRVAFFGLDLQSRLRVLAKADNIATSATMHAVHLGQLQVAMEILEQGRGVFWSQALRLRTPLDGLPEGRANKLKEVAARLETKTREPTSRSADENKAAGEEEALRLRQLSEKFEELIAQVRTISGHERFLLHDKYSELLSVTCNGPVIVFLSGKHHCIAIALRTSESPRAIDLPDVTPDELLSCGAVLRDAQEDYRQDTLDAGPVRNDIEVDRLGIAARRSSDRIVGVLDELWEKVIRPVVQALGLPVSLLLELQ